MIIPARRSFGRFGLAPVRTVMRRLVWSVLWCCLGVVQAQTVPPPAANNTYAYDGNGRLTAITKTDGTSAQYSYDALGNLTQISTLPAGQLAVFAFTPSHGTAGTAVTIAGQGFSSVLANNGVSFNGSPATVATATSSQLVATVPTGASTGPISVKVSSQTASSAVPFVVDDTGAPPTITQVSPVFVATGMTVTVTGTHLDPLSGYTSVQVGGQDVLLSSIDDNHLQFVVPAGNVSGYVTVQTPYGQAVSASPVLELPNGVNANNVVSSGAAVVNGAPVMLSMGAVGQTGALVFNATANSWFSLQVSGISPVASSISYTVYAPGNVVIKQGSLSTASPSIHLPHLTVGGNYLVLFQSNTAGTQLVVGIENNVLMAPDTSVAMVAGLPMQSRRLLFTIRTGDNLELTLNGVNAPGASTNGFQVDIYDPSGSDIASYTCFASNPGASCAHALWSLAAGTYGVVVSPSYGGTVSFNALLKRDVQGAPLVVGAPAMVNLGAGQVERLTFNANAGDVVTLQLSNVNTIPAGQYVYVSVFRPDTGAIAISNAYTSFSATTSNQVNLPNLPVSGTYIVMVYTAYGEPGSAQLTRVPNVTGTLQSNGASQSYAANVAGQNVYLSFNASAGDNLDLTLNGVNVPGASTNAFQVDIYNPTGTNIASLTCFASNPGASCAHAMWGLTAGVYSVVVSPVYGGTVSFNALLKREVEGAPLVAGAPTTINLGAGQVERLTFDANAGDVVTLQLSNVNTIPAGQYIYVSVFRPDTGAIAISNAYTSFSATTSNQVNLPNLPVSGTYIVMIYTAYGEPGSAQLTRVPNVTGTLQSNGASQSYAANVAGQNAYLSFNASAGDNLGLTLNGVNVPGASTNAFQVDIYNPSGTNIASYTCFASNPGASCVYRLWGIAAGTYSVVVSPTYGGTVSFNALLEREVEGASLVAGAPATINLGAGQVERLTFNANAGDGVTLLLSNVNTMPAGQYVYVSVFRPDTGAIAISNAYTSFSATTSNQVNLPNLPVSGTYIVMVYTAYGEPGNAQLTLVPGAASTLPINGSAQSVIAMVAGQNVYLSFNASVGDNLELTLNGVNVPGASTNAFQVDIYNPSGTNIASYTCFASNPGASCAHAMWGLTAGVYSVVISPTYGGTVSFNALLEREVEGSTLVAGATATVNLGASQVERLTFNANAGDGVTLQLSNVSTMPAGQYVYVSVFRPDTGAIAISNAYTSFSATTSNQVNLPNLPVSGTYIVMVYTAYGEPGSAQLTRVPNVTGALLPNGASQSYATNVPGQNAHLSFNASTGDNLELTLNGVNAPGASTNGFQIDIYDPSGSDIASFTCFASNPGASCAHAMWGLTAGVYSVVVSPTYGGTVSFNALLEREVEGAPLVAGAPATINLGASQVERLTFNANAGNGVTLQLSNVSTMPAGQYVYVSVFRPDTGAIAISNAYMSFSATTSNQINLPNLPLSGTYIVMLYTAYGEPGSAQLTLVSQ